MLKIYRLFFIKKQILLSLFFGLGISCLPSQFLTTINAQSTVPLSLASKTNVSCNGANDGTIRLTPAGNISTIISETGDATNDLLQPIATATDSQGNVYVVGKNSNNVFKITPAGVVTQIINANGNGISPLSQPENGLAVDANDNVYVSGTNSHNVFKITPTGNITEIINSLGDGVHPFLGGQEIAIDPTGNIYVAGSTTNNVFKITPQGSISQIIDESGDGSNVLSAPESLTTDTNNNVYVVGINSWNAFKITPAGVITQIIDATGDGSNTLSFANDIVTDQTGNVYVSGNGSNNVFKITPTGVITQIFDSAGDGMNTAAGISSLAINAAGSLFVGASGTRNIFEVVPNGTITQIMDALGDGTNPLLATHLSIATNDVLYVAGSSGNNFVFKVRLDGSSGISYSINGINFQVSNEFMELAAGNYTVTAKNEFAQTSKLNVSIIQPTVTTLSIESIACGTANKGSIIVSAQGGTAPFMYSRDNGTTFQASDTFNGLAAGNYQIVVKDNKDCLTTAQQVSVADCILPFTINLSGDISFAEGTGGTNIQTFTITRSQSTVGAISVNFVIYPYGVDPVDAADFVTNPFGGQTINFADGEATKTVSINVTTDAAIEKGETCLAVIQDVTGGGIYENSYLELTITDDDSPEVGIAGDDIMRSCETTVGIGSFDFETVPTSGSWRIVSGTGGSFENRNELLTSFTGVMGTSYLLEWSDSNGADEVCVSFDGDTDDDGIQDCYDRCPLFDDNIDTDMDGAPDACDCDPNNANDATLTLPDGTMMSGVIPSDRYESSGTITSTGTVESGSDVTYKAAVSITLNAGFEVESGALFYAHIAPCTFNPDYEVPASTNEEVTERFSESETTPLPTTLRVTAQPNPTSNIVQI
ncbi:MAG: SBBP repeat-containing protein, partial [Saprospiraceae bacterium]